MEAVAGIEPTMTEFAAQRLATWLHGLIGASGETRTRSLLVRSQVPFQFGYGRVWHVRQDSNLQSPGSKPGALFSLATDVCVFGCWLQSEDLHPVRVTQNHACCSLHHSGRSWLQDEDSHLDCVIQSHACCWLHHPGMKG